MLGTCCKLKLRNTILPTHSFNNAPGEQWVPALHISNPDLATSTFFLFVLYFAPSSPHHQFFSTHCHSLFFHDDKRTNERMNEQTNDRTVTFLFSCHAHLLLTITNFLPFASFLFLLTLDRLNDDDDDKDDDDANDDSVTASCRPKSPF
jgi:hypothetical protein